jgi:cob(I)alamin adenosyltransferase
MGMIYVFTGDGKGKTSAALGTAMRSAGHGGRVVMIQFMKGRETGEAIFSRKARVFDLLQFGRDGFVNLKKPSKEDKKSAAVALKVAGSILSDNPPDLLVLDEINVAMHAGLITTKSVMAVLRKIPKKTHVILTGRGAPKEVVAVADLVTEMKDIKHPFRKGVKAVKGLDF